MTMPEYIDRKQIEWKSFPYDSGEWYPDYAEKKDIDQMPTLDVATIKVEAVKEFAERLKKKVQKPEFPWEDFFICESDIDEVLKEMESENK